MNNIKKFFLESSADSSKLSATLTGIMASVVSIITLYVSFHGGTAISQDQVTSIVQNATVVVSSIGTAIGAIVAIWGIFRKIAISLKGN